MADEKTVRMKYSGSTVMAPAEMIAANPGRSALVEHGEERDVPEAMAKQLAGTDDWSKVRSAK